MIELPGISRVRVPRFSWQFVALGLAALVVVGLPACSLTPDDDGTDAAVGGPTWVDAWQASPAGPVPQRCSQNRSLNAFPQHQASQQTIRYAVRPSVSGDRVRVRLSNRFGQTPLVVTRVAVARPAVGAAITAGTSRDALFAGGRAVTIPAGGEATSDDVAFDAQADRPVTISAAMASGGPLSWHPTGPPSAYATRAGTGDHTQDVRASAFGTQLYSFVALAGLEVRTAARAATIVAFGDSLTDAGNSGASNSWVEVLAKRLRAARRPRAVSNAGIACNALTYGNAVAGPKAADRFAADVLDRPGVSHVIVFLGTNDLQSGATGDQMIAALTALARRARAAGVKVIGATIIPSNGSPRQRTANRQAVNKWIRTTKQLDGFIDFDAVIRSSGNTGVMNPRYRGDNVHPNARGQVAMGSAIPLSLFA